MNNKIIFLLAFLVLAGSVNAQNKFYTKSGKINFYSITPLEDIEAVNKSVAAVLDAPTGTLHFSVLMQGFEFENEEMQEHFNDDYLETKKFPKAEFKGQILNNSAIAYTKPGTYPVQIKGQLTLHGVTRDIQTAGTVKVEGDHLKANSTFNIQVADYNIRIPPLVKDKIAKTVRIVVDTRLEPLGGK